MTAPLGIGVVGAGRFAEFCMGAFATLDEVRVVAVMDVDAARARAVAPARAAIYTELGGLLGDAAVDVVHVASPPATHGQIARRAAEHGKHVFVEKPLAVTLDEGRAAVAAAERAGVILAVNYVLRRDPLHQLGLWLTHSGVFGALRHFSLVNLAALDPVPVGHWFWDRAVSGGIHVEHGVHFFDLCLGHTGRDADQVNGISQSREDGIVDRECAIVRFGDEAVATFVHGFIRSTDTERTTIRLDYERGQVAIEGWIPTRLTLDGLVATAAEADRLRDRLTAGECAVEPYRQNGGRSLSVAGSLTVADRQEQYRHAIRAGMADLVRAVREGGEPLVTGRDSLPGLELALRAAGQTAR